MKRLISLMICAVSLGAAAQITYPYNPLNDGFSIRCLKDTEE